MFSTYRLGQHQAHAKYLRDEVETMLKLPITDQYKNLPLMESFLREVARHDPLDSCKCFMLYIITVSKMLSVSVQRKVLRDFKFSDGSCVPAGNVICVPQQAVMRDQKHYDRPDEFLPMRFVKGQGDSQDDDAIQKLTDLKPHFFLWGATAKPW